MAEYIEREVVMRKINGEFPDAHYPSWYSALLEEIPAADVVEVVRCGKCKFTDDRSAYGIVCTCDHGGMLGSFVAETDFCSYGERRCE